MTVLASLLLAGLSGLACDPAAPVAVPLEHRVAVAPPSHDVTLAPSADTYLRRDHPNRNEGTARVLRLSGEDRVLLLWDPAGLAAAIGSDSLVGASLELTVTERAEHHARHGGPVTLHRLTQAWSETGATWNCAVDADPGNHRADCAGETAWEMDRPKVLRPYLATPSAAARIRTRGRGREREPEALRFDVTADVAALSAGGGAQDGWLLQQRGRGFERVVDFGSRESDSPPRLVLTLVQQQDTSRPPVPDSFTYPADTTLWVAPPPNLPSDTLARYYRNVIGIRFDDSTSGVTVRRVLQKYGATIIGGIPFVEEYIVRVPDPGPTFDALANLIGAISNEPGVDYAAGLKFRDVIKGSARYPSDGTDGQRRDWLGTATDATRAWRQIRAPLAWGCETGAYDQERVKVGVIDWLFDTSQDFEGASVTLTQPGATDKVSADPELRDPVHRSHGTAVAGVLAATGDNGTGVAGMLWRPDLHLFALSRDDSMSVQDASEYLARTVFRLATERGVRVLVASVNAGTTDSLEVVRLQRAMAQYVRAGRGNLFVFAAGNEGVSQSLASIQQLTGARHLGLMVATARMFGTQPDHFLIVGGTDATGAFWKDPLGGSNFWLGATDIVAPATSIRMLVRASGDFPQGALVAGGGTSLSAPFVGGVAGLLLAMDSDLTAADVKDYIKRGAQEPKGWSAPGVEIPATKVDGAPETVYQLDAYGSLSLLSRERPGTPICGVPVSVSADGKVVLQRTPPETLSVTPPTGTAVRAVSVAQGGRRIALRAVGAPGLVAFETDQHGATLHTLTGVSQRFYLEKDTADVVTDAQGLATVLLRGEGPVQTIPISARIPVASDGALMAGTTVVPSPDGAWFAAFDVVWGPPHLPPDPDSLKLPPVAWRWDLVPRSPGASIVPVYYHSLDNSGFDCIVQGSFCEPAPDPHATPHAADWDASGQRVVLTVGQLQRAPTPAGVRLRTLAYSVPVVGGVPQVPAPTVTLPDVWLRSVSVLPSDSAVRSVEHGAQSSNCVTTLRWATALASAWGATPLVACADPGRRFNAPPSIAGLVHP